MLGLERTDEEREADEAPYITKTGKVLTDADIEALADEAERGYDISKLKPRSQASLRPVSEEPPAAVNEAGSETL